MNQDLQTEWQPWSPRPEIAPRFAVEAGAGRRGGAALRMDGGGNSAVFGVWRRRIEGIQGDRPYAFEAFCRARNIAHERRNLAARLVWLDAAGQPARPPDYALDVEKENGWTRVAHTAVAPENARSVLIELALLWSANGTVWWDDVTLQEVPAPKERVVRAATVYHRPSGTRSAAESVESFCRLLEASPPQPLDILCLPEGVSIIGNGLSYAQVAEPLPGPTTRRLGALAKRLRSYLVAGVIERDGATLYNTAVLIGRDGEIAGTYRKTHLPREEVEGGLTPGDAYPVFQVDFGKLGLMICWDVQFPEPARALALRGGELILLPIWGGSEILARARAIENHVFLISSSYDMRTFVVNPAGEVLAEADREHPLAVASLNLDRKIVQPWIGDMKTRAWKERRPDIPVELR